MKKSTIFILLCWLVVAGCAKRASRDYLSERTPEEKRARMTWWKEARFGMFIHWGLYAIPAGTYEGEEIPFLGEWIMNEASIPLKTYEKYGPKFNPVKFDAGEWVRLAKRAGMRYIVITSKHHDGFGLWRSKMTTWDIIDATPFGRDILHELAEACRAEGIPLGFYYSIMDWHHPDAQSVFEPFYSSKELSNPRFPHYVESYMKPQLRELLGGTYGDIDILWFDGDWIKDWTVDRGRDLYNYVRNLNPDILINNRIGRVVPDDPRDVDSIELIGDFGTPEQRIPHTGLPGVDWESCVTMNDTWGYKSYDDNWKSSELLTRALVDIVSKGGNLLLNVGPTAEGLIPGESVERLQAMGRWLDVNGESIYGADVSPLGATRWGRFTRKDATLYAHVFAWPADGVLVMPKPRGEISKIYLLADKKREPRAFQITGTEVVVDVPREAPDPVDTVLVVEGAI